MKKLLSVILAILVMGLPLLSVCAEAEQVSMVPLSEVIEQFLPGEEGEEGGERSDGLIGKLIGTVDELIAPFKFLYERLRTIILAILEKAGISKKAKVPEFTFRVFTEERLPDVYHPLIDEFCSVITKAKVSSALCTATESVTSEVKIPGSSGGEKVNSSVEYIVGRACPEYSVKNNCEWTSETDLNNYILPYGLKDSFIDYSKVKTGERRNLPDGTSEITLVFYAETFDDTAPYLAAFTPYGIFTAEKANHPAFKSEQFSGTVENFAFTIHFNTLTHELLDEQISFNAHYDIYGTYTMSEKNSSTGWAYADASVNIALTLYRK